jgi:hypothetical protein
MYLWWSKAGQIQKSNTYITTSITPHRGRSIRSSGRTTRVKSIIFDNLNKLPRPYTSEDSKASAIACGYPVNYVRSGNPNGTVLPRWDTVTGKNPATLEMSPAIAMRPLLEMLAFCKEYFDSRLPVDAPIFLSNRAVSMNRNVQMVQRSPRKVLDNLSRFVYGITRSV